MCGSSSWSNARSFNGTKLYQPSRTAYEEALWQALFSSDKKRCRILFFIQANFDLFDIFLFCYKCNKIPGTFFKISDSMDAIWSVSHIWYCWSTGTLFPWFTIPRYEKSRKPDLDLSQIIFTGRGELRATGLGGGDHQGARQGAHYRASKYLHDDALFSR